MWYCCRVEIGSSWYIPKRSYRSNHKDAASRCELSKHTRWNKYKYGYRSIHIQCICITCWVRKRNNIGKNKGWLDFCKGSWTKRWKSGWIYGRNTQKNIGGKTLYEASNSTSVQDIARSLKISRATCYRYLKVYNDLFGQDQK